LASKDLEEKKKTAPASSQDEFGLGPSQDPPRIFRIRLPSEWNLLAEQTFVLHQMALLGKQ